MKFFVRATKRYLLEAKEHSCENVFRRFKDEIEGRDNYKINPRHVYFGKYYKKPHQNFRSIFYMYDFMIGNEQVKCFLALCILKRGDAEYERFINDSADDARRAQITGLNDFDFDALEEELSQALNTGGESSGYRPLNEFEKMYIGLDTGITQEIFKDGIYESREWIDSVNSNDFSLFHMIAVAINEFIETQILSSEEQFGFHEIPYGDHGEMILCAQLPHGRNWSWFLLARGNEETIRTIREKYDKDLDPQDFSHAHEVLATKCMRAYPLSMIEDDEDFWREMERDKNSNFILSSEELDIVQGKHKLPLFISGRAGSGKSTMLQYLFADYLLRYCQNDKVLPPAYLSYSIGLVDNAKKLSSSLFKSNHTYAEVLNDSKKSFKDIEPLFEKVFFVFQQLVRDCIRVNNPQEDILAERFAMADHITYDKFRKLWKDKFGKTSNAEKEYGPALSWHVIRTYIKGWDSEAYCEPDDFQEIGRDSKSVSQQTFNIIYERVWKEWYEPFQKENHMWDDQDLVRYCLAPDDDSCETCAKERFSAIFCDESQDFTRIETEFILQISLFSHRKIEQYQLEMLPFVFVGDEFQTINPTGFSWDSLRSYFTERMFFPNGSKGGVNDPVILTKNYRSTAPIVKLANRLQLLREVRFPGKSRNAPQTTYYADTEGVPVYCLDPHDRKVWTILGQMQVALIIPCAEGQSAKDFIEKSPIKGMIDFDSNGSPKNITIYNPIQAKGLEYPYIALYGFDDLEPELKLEELKKWLKAKNPEKDSETREIELKYFLSNAYVSATRAKSQLFIISDFSETSFWAFAFFSQNNAMNKKVLEIESLMLEHINSGGKSNEIDWEGSSGEKRLGYILEGDVGTIGLGGIIDAGEIARMTEDRGIELRDPSLMYQAAARYRARKWKRSGAWRMPTSSTSASSMRRNRSNRPGYMKRRSNATGVPFSRARMIPSSWKKSRNCWPSIPVLRQKSPIPPAAPAFRSWISTGSLTICGSSWKKRMTTIRTRTW